MRYDAGVANQRRKPKRSRLVAKPSGQTISIVESDVRNLFLPIHLYPLIDTKHLIAYNRVNQRLFRRLRQGATEADFS